MVNGAEIEPFIMLGSNGAVDTECMCVTQRALMRASRTSQFSSAAV